MSAPILLLAACGSPSVPCRAEITAFADGDGDGYGEAPLGLVCALTAGQSELPTDCDDADPLVHPGARERCDGVDDDCDGTIDEGRRLVQWWADEDGDGHGGRFPSVLACKAPDGAWAASDDDCDDDDPTVYPGALERCGGGDEDCDGRLDDDDDNLDPDGLHAFYRDLDGDVFGDPRHAVHQCLAPAGFTADASDCDDRDPTIRPTADEVCDDGVDDDCDGLSDDADPSLDLITATTWYADVDGDGFGDDASSTLACVAPPRHVAQGGDCDDRDPSVHVDQRWLPDADQDGWGTLPLTAPSCQPPGAGYVPAGESLDCDDGRSDIHPWALDTCGDGLDSDCDGQDCDPCAELVVGVLPSWSTSTSGSLFFRTLTRTWSSYGTCPLRVIDVSTPITVASLDAAGVTVLWSTDPAGANRAYSGPDTTAIHDFVQQGHGGLVASFLEDYSTTNDSAIMDLVGVEPADLDAQQVACQMRVDVREPTHPLAAHVPASFTLSTYQECQALTTPWPSALLPGATLVAESADALDVVVGYEQPSWRGVYLSSMFEYQNETNTDALQLAYDAAYWASGY